MEPTRQGFLTLLKVREDQGKYIKILEQCVVDQRVELKEIHDKLGSDKYFPPKQSDFSLDYANHTIMHIPVEPAVYAYLKEHELGYQLFVGWTNKNPLDYGCRVLIRKYGHTDCRTDQQRRILFAIDDLKKQILHKFPINGI